MLDGVSGGTARLHKLIDRLLPHRKNGSCAHSADVTGCGEVEGWSVPRKNTKADKHGGAWLPRDVGKASKIFNFRESQLREALRIDASDL